MANLKDLLNKFKTVLFNATQDDEGLVRKGKFTPVQQVKQMGQNLQGWGNVAKQGVQNQIDIQKRDFNKYTWQPLKQNPVLAPTLQRFEDAIPALGRSAKQLIPFTPKQTPQQNWQDTKKIASAGLTAYGLAKAPLSAILGGAVINPLIKIGTNIYENKQGQKSNVSGQSIQGVPSFAQQKYYQQKPITQGVGNAVFEGAGTGLANAGTTRLTNSLVQHFSTSIPLLNKLTEKSISSNLPNTTDTISQATKKFFTTAGKRLIKAAVIETAVETPIWATLTQSEKETYVEALQREAVENLVMNVGMAGVQSLGDVSKLTPIVKQSINKAADDYWKKTSSPENIKKQGGYIDFMGNTVDGTDRTNRFNNLVDTYYKPNATVQEKVDAYAEIRRLAGDVLSKEKIKQLTNIETNKDPENLIMALSDVINKDIKTNRGYKEPFTLRNFLANKELQRGGMDLTDKTKPFPQTPSRGVIPEVKPIKITEPFIDKSGELQFPGIKTKNKGIEMTSEETQTAADFSSFKAEEDPKVFKKIFADWIGKRESSKTKATVEASKFSNVPGNPEDIIKSVEGGNIKLSPEQQTYSTELRKTYDKLFEEAKKEGVDMNYLENYLTHIWDKPITQVAQEYKNAKQTFGFAGNRSLPTYEEGIKMGLVPKYNNTAQILEDYTRRLNETFANIELFKNLKKEGLIVSGNKVSNSPDFAPINAPGFPRARATIGDQQTVISNWYAPKNVANQINRIFTPQDYGMLGKVAETGAKVSGAIQDITLSGGLPKTPLNAWSVAQVTKEVLSGRIISPFKNLFRSLSTNASNKFFEENAGQIIKMQERNIPLQTTFETKNLINQSTAKKLFGDSVGSAWNKVMNEPTFKLFMPQLQISLFNDIEAKLISKGIDQKQAADTAAQAVKNFYGIVGSDVLASRNKLGKDLTQTVLFAPRYRESMINFWANNIKALKNPFSAENITNTKFSIGAIMTFIAMNAVNKANTGKNMWENPEGKEDKMLIKTQDGYIGVPFLSSIATIPRLTIKTGKHLISGNLPETVNDMKSLLSSGVRPVVDIFTNEDYFGGEIYDPDSTNKWGDIGLYLAGQYNHPYIREIMNVAGQSLSPEVKKKLGLNKQSVPAYQTFSKALELPFRFYNNKVGRDALSSAYYYESKDEALKELNSKEKQIYTTLEQTRPDDISASADIQMDMAEALTLLANPSVLRTKAKTAIDTAAKTGETLDPFYTLTPEQQQTVLRLKTFYPGDKEKSNITNENIDWLKPYWTARSAYFDELESKGIIQPQEESEEYASPEMQKKLDYYYTLPYGTGARTQYINANPDLVEYWDKKRAITNEKRAELGLTQQEGFTKYAKKPKKVSISASKSIPKISIAKSSAPKVSNIKISAPPVKSKSTKGGTKITQVYKAPKLKTIKIQGLSAGVKLV